MDTRDEIKQMAHEKKHGRAECECNGTCELAFKLAGEIHHYRDAWEKIEDQHFPACPVAIAARGKRKSTLCLCDKLEIANREAEECLRCHNLVADCRCGAKAQLV